MSNTPDIFEKIAALAAALPDEAIANIPRDGATNHDHYLYGAPKKMSDYTTEIADWLARHKWRELTLNDVAVCLAQFCEDKVREARGANGASNADLAELRRLISEIGPLAEDPEGDGPFAVVRGNPCDPQIPSVGWFRDLADAANICAVVNSLPALLDRLEAAGRNYATIEAHWLHEKACKEDAKKQLAAAEKRVEEAEAVTSRLLGAIESMLQDADIRTKRYMSYDAGARFVDAVEEAKAGGAHVLARLAENEKRHADLAGECLNEEGADHAH